MDELFIGLMSGTSLDGADGVLAAFPDGRAQVLAHAHRPFDSALRGELLALNTAGHNELHRAALAANALTRMYSEVVTALCEAAPGRAVRAIGAHGQTVRHRPGQFDGTGYTLQLNAPALLAELTGIAVVADLRSRDLAAGGQGAPLVPAFHNAQFACAGQDIAVANIGGIANLSLLGADGAARGFDCGPGNALMDLWCLRHRGAAFDDRGRWAAQGQVLPALLDAALRDPYFALSPPKSTGRDDFHADWLDALLAGQPSASARDVQATLCELTARTVANGVHRHLPRARELLVCGGGALNDELMRRLAQALPQFHIESTASRGLAPLHVEAAAFAWLARAHLRGEPGNLSAVTGARGPRLLGALYPA
ncbi:MAG: anhydro-N-acetylmuramic acid kinase [Methylibium sp.]|nr:anhydro-N-acetylmuramic acid kinase [Methylibium sp.]